MPPTIPRRGGPIGGGKGKGAAHRRGKVSGKTVMGGGKRHRKIAKDSIRGISNADIRRMARRGGVKRISALIYDEVRNAMKQRLEMILRDVCTMVEYRMRKTVTTIDVIFCLRRLGRPIYGFDPETYHAPTKRFRATQDD